MREIAYRYAKDYNYHISTKTISKAQKPYVYLLISISFPSLLVTLRFIFGIGKIAVVW